MMPPTTRAGAEVVTHDLREWQGVISRALAPVEMSAIRPAEFQGHVRSRTLSGVRFTRIVASAHALNAVSVVPPRSVGTTLNVSLQLSGAGEITQAGRTALIAPGEFVLFDTSEGYQRVFDQDHSTLVLNTDAARAGVSLARIREMRARTVTTTGVVRAMASRLLLDAASVFDELPPVLAERVSGSVVDLVIAGLMEQFNETETIFGPRGSDGLHERAVDVIRERFRDPDVDSSDIARACFVSVRHLHTVFAARGTTVAGELRTHRLRTAEALLRDPTVRHLTIETVAQWSGFTNPSHFTRAFRSRFGVTPSAYRSTGHRPPAVSDADV